VQADADGATEISDLDKLLPALQAAVIDTNLGHVAMAVGSRAHLASQSVASRAFYRTVLMRGFHLYVQMLVTQSVQDTQCGFKLFTSPAAKVLFHYLHLYRWAFDTELIYLAEGLHIPILEVAVNWREVEGSKLITSKLDVVTTSLTMARDILCMRLSYLLRVWDSPLRIHDTHDRHKDSKDVPTQEL
jgi:dolichyl-phosphate beta-glucosyltransferase